MGAGICQSDQYKQIHQLYGDQIKKQIVWRKGKQFLDRQITKLRNEVGVASKRYEDEQIKIVNESQNYIRQFYTKVLKQLNNRQVGGIKSLQQMKNKQIDQLLGYKYIQSIFNQLKNNLKNAYKQEQIAILNELTEVKIAHELQVNQQFEESILSCNISAIQRQDIQKRLQMQFHSQISQYEQILFARYSQRLIMKNYQDRLKSIDCKETLSNFVLMSKDKLRTSLNLILGEKIDSYILIE